MNDIFDAKIMCKDCDVEMEKGFVNKNGFHLRAVKCPKCGDKIIHPQDSERYENYNGLKGKVYNVKLRVVGNSHAISIPKEVVDFMNEQHREIRKEMDDMVRLCFEDFDKLSIKFGDEEDDR